MMAARKSAKGSKETLPFRHHLVLNQWLFSLFGFDSLSGQFDLGNREAPTLEAFRDRFQLIGETSGRNAEGEHLIIQRMRENLNENAKLSDEQLLEYDRRIKQLTDTINNARLAVSVHSRTPCHPAEFRPTVTSHSSTRGYPHEKTPHPRAVAGSA